MTGKDVVAFINSLPEEEQNLPVYCLSMTGNDRPVTAVHRSFVLRMQEDHSVDRDLEKVEVLYIS